jgi:hypothetical protein
VSRLVFLLEEFSMKVFLEEFLPRFFPGLEFLCIPHEGRHDLEKSIPRKLRSWREPGVRFLILRDNDGGDCRAIKEHLTSLCLEGRRDDALVRIACQELEAWYLGEPDALATAFSRDELRAVGNGARYRDPDSVVKPSAEIERLVPGFQKVSGARQMARHLSLDGNRSRSFQALIRGIEREAVAISRSSACGEES